MKTIYLIRFYESDQGTKGIWFTEGFKCRCIELPWKNNKQSISCIPSGEYNCKIHNSRKYGKVYKITNVENRSWILAHNGNFAGDTTKGFRTHSRGCVILGKYHGKIENQDAVCLSRVTLRRFMNFMNYENFKLIVESI